jgi:hypothetical protein
VAGDPRMRYTAVRSRRTVAPAQAGDLPGTDIPMKEFAATGR